MSFVRRVRADEWVRVRDLRLEAVSDPDAAIAFLSTYAEDSERDDEFWRDRAAHASAGGGVAQFVLEESGEWVGTASAIRRAAGSSDHLGRVLSAARTDIVGVYIRPEHRGRRGIDLLFDAIAEWARDCGDSTLTLDVHADNARAQSAYRRAGFRPTGVAFTGPIGPEIEMARDLAP